MPFVPAAGLYVHIPFCASKCDYCDFFSIPSASGAARAATVRAYVGRLLTDLEAQTRKGIFVPLNTIYLGGGTPSLLSPSDIARLFQGIRRLVPLAAGAEVTIEANPEGITVPWLVACEAAGINRISLGVQSSNDASLAAVHRRADRACALAALALLRDRWSGTVSVDLIAGLPAETRTTFRAGIEQVLDYHPHHVSLYALTVEAGTPLYDRAAAEENNHKGHKVTQSKDDEDLWLLGRDLLEAAGYEQYEVSNFARPGFECRHNLAYWESRSWAAVGAAASGTLYRDDGSALRYTATHDPESYLYQEEEVSRDTALFEYLMMGFRLRRGVSASAFEARLGTSLGERIGAASPGGLFTRWEEQGLAGRAVSPQGERYFLTRSGMLFLNRFLQDL
jgi:oxygen-independent coproporphyrinogen-3 oxidase